MGGFNLPHVLMNLTFLAFVGSAGVVCLGAVLWELLPLWLCIVLSVPLGHTVLVALAVSAAASKPLERRSTWLFGKREDGLIPWPRWLLLWPFHVAAKLVMTGYRALAKELLVSKIEQGIYLGGCPSKSSDLPAGKPVALLDVTCEMPRLVDCDAYKVLLSWETHGLPPELMQEGVDWALDQRAQGRAVLTYCTHGHSRSAIMVCAQLVAAGVVRDIDEAQGKVKEVRSGIHPNKRQWAALERWFKRYRGRGAAPAPSSSAGGSSADGSNSAPTGAEQV